MRSLAHFIPFQDDLVLYKKYFMLSKEMCSVSLKHTTVKPTQVELAHLQLYVYISSSCANLYFECLILLFPPMFFLFLLELR